MGRFMARNSLIAAPLQAKRYQQKAECFYAVMIIMENTQILHYQGIAGHMPARHFFNYSFRVNF